MHTQASVCVVFTDVLLGKVNHMIKSKVIVETHFTSFRFQNSQFIGGHLFLYCCKKLVNHFNIVNASYLHHHYDHHHYHQLVRTS